LITVLNGFGECGISAQSSAFKKYEEFVGLSAFMSVEKTWSTVKTFGFWVNGVENFFVKVGIIFGKG
jgi:hypothetical protein